LKQRQATDLPEGRQKKDFDAVKQCVKSGTNLSRRNNEHDFCGGESILMRKVVAKKSVTAL